MNILTVFLLPIAIVLTRNYDGPTMQKPCKCSSDYESCIESSELEKPKLDSKSEDQLIEEADCMKECLADDLGNLVNCVYSEETVKLMNAIEQCRQSKYDELPVENLGCKTKDYNSIEADPSYNTQPLSFMAQDSVYDCTMKCMGSVTYTSNSGSSHTSFSGSGGTNGFATSSSHGGHASASSSSGPGSSSHSSHSSSSGPGSSSHSSSSGPGSSSHSSHSSSSGPGSGSSSFSQSSSSHSSSSSGFTITKLSPGQSWSSSSSMATSNRAKRDTIFVDGGIIISGDRITGPQAMVDGDRVTGPNTMLSKNGFRGITANTGPFDSRTLIDCARENDCYPVPPKVAGCEDEIKEYKKKINQCFNGGSDDVN